MVSKIITLKCVCLFFAICLTAQRAPGQTYFNNRYDSFGSCDLTTGVDTMYNGYLSAQTICTPESDYTFLLALYNPDGTLRTNKLYSRPRMNVLPNNGQYLRANNQDFLVSGYRVYKNDTSTGFIWRFNSQLDSVSYFEYGYLNKFNVISSFAQSGKYIYMTGYVDSLETNNDLLLIKADTLGNEVWKKKIGLPWTDEGGSVIKPSQDGNLIICGYKNQHNDYSYSGAYILKVDTGGAVLWQQWFPTSHGEGAAGFEELPNGDIFITACKGVGSGFVGTIAVDYVKLQAIKLASSGSLIFNKTYGTPMYGATFCCMIKNHRGNLVAAGQLASFPIHGVSGVVYELNQNGDSLFSKEYRLLPSSQNYFRAMLQTPDKGYCFAGFVIPYSPDTGTEDVWLLKTDSNFCESPGICYAGLEEASPKETFIKTYPNPAKDELCFLFEDEYAAVISIKIYDIHGRLLVAEVFKNIHGLKRLGLQDLEDGVYTYEVTAGSSLLKKDKFVIIK